VFRDFLRLHIIVFLWGITGVLGKYINLPAADLVCYRTAIAGLCLLIIGKICDCPFKLPARTIWSIIGVGMLMGLHWLLFFHAINISNVSVTMAGFATMSLWIAIFEPLIIRGRKFRGIEFLVGFIALTGIWLIFRVEFGFWLGMLSALGCAMIGALFSIFTGIYARRHNPIVVSFYHMVGGTVFCFLAAVIKEFTWGPDGSVLTLPTTGVQIAALLTLAIACTVYAFTESVALLKRLSVFTIVLTNNLEPVYGIALAAICFREYDHVSGYFYLGAGLILLSVFLYPVIERIGRRRKRL
jgi:drug/metabolite transporter (DMT)-like permease